MSVCWEGAGGWGMGEFLVTRSLVRVPAHMLPTLVYDTPQSGFDSSLTEHLLLNFRYNLVHIRPAVAGRAGLILNDIISA